MSSDSDSDVCDFTSDVSKQMSKNLNKFWDTYKEKEVASTHKAEAITIEDNIAISSITTTEQCQPDVKSIQEPDTNIPERITNKLNELSAEVETLLEDKRKRRKRGSRRPQTRSTMKKKANAKSSGPSLSTLLTLSSDDEVTPVALSNLSNNGNKTDLDVNPIVTVQVLWKSVEKNFFKVPKYQLLGCVPKYYCEKFNVDPKLLFFTLDDKQLNLSECSFVSLRLQENKVIEGGILPKSFLPTGQANTVTAVNIDGDLNFKVQYSDQRTNGINVKSKKEDNMEIIFWQVAKYIKKPVECVKLYFDGRLVHPNNKVSELDLEEGDCFDLEIIKKCVNQ